ncbi:MAG: Ig domain-containing protein [Myxococcota bacterium]
MALPVRVTLAVPGAPLIYLQSWFDEHDADGPRTTADRSLVRASSRLSFRIGVNPDRDFVDESYELRVTLTDRDGATRVVEVPIHVCDQDRERPPEFRFTRRILNTYGDSWIDGGGEPWDYNEDGIHDGVQAQAMIHQIIDDVEYYLADWSVDTVPVDGAASFVSWRDDDLLPGMMTNDVPIDTFHLFITQGVTSTGQPGFTTHTRDGAPTDLKAIGVVIIDRQLPPEWVERNYVDGWHFHDGVSEDWWRSSRWRWGPSPTDDCPPGEAVCRFFATSFYSVMKHELLHTLAYQSGWPRWAAFRAGEVECVDDEAVMAFTGRCSPIQLGNHSWDPQLHRRIQGAELLDMYELLVMQAVGWELRETTPFVDLASDAPVLPDARVGLPFDAVVAVWGGVPAYRFTVASGVLPDGVVLDSFTGRLSGAPTRAGAYRVELEVADSGVAEPIRILLDLTVRP